MGSFGFAGTQVEDADEPDSFVSTLDPRTAAEEADLLYVSDAEPGISRRRAGRGFTYRLPGGAPLRDAATLRRIRALAVPPAWSSVWICCNANGHLQATGRDARGRKQYLYHARWRQVRDTAKFDRLAEFARVLPKIRARIAADMARPGLPRDKVLATIVHLLERTLIRIGNEDYARYNGSYGLTTLRSRHVVVDGTELRFTFKGKGGKTWQLRLQDRRIARVIRSCQELPGQELLRYRDRDGTLHDLSSADVNTYLRDITGCAITAKDFRTWAGTVLAARALAALPGADSPAAAKRSIKAAIEHVATKLGNTASICRKCYVHPAVVACYLAGSLERVLRHSTPEQVGEPAEVDAPGMLRPEEIAVLSIMDPGSPSSSTERSDKNIFKVRKPAQVQT